MTRVFSLCTLLGILGGSFSAAEAAKPNILFIFSDDHAQHAISAYGSKVNQTPHIDRLAREGVRFKNSFVANSICTPSVSPPQPRRLKALRKPAAIQTVRSGSSFRSPPVAVPICWSARWRSS